MYFIYFPFQDKERMAAHIKGLDSIIQGLRSERKLWGQELAQQGKLERSMNI